MSGHGRGPLDYLALPWLFVATVALVLGAVEAGYRLGRHRRRSEVEHEAPVGTVVGAALALLAFVLAFTFGMAASRYDTRRELLQEEVNAIGTAYLRTSFLTEPARGEMRARCESTWMRASRGRGRATSRRPSVGRKAFTRGCGRRPRVS